VTILFFGFFLVFTLLVLTAELKRASWRWLWREQWWRFLISAPPAQAQASLLAAIQAVLNTINGVIPDSSQLHQFRKKCD